jgi:hypothetical protein
MIFASYIMLPTDLLGQCVHSGQKNSHCQLGVQLLVNKTVSVSLHWANETHLQAASRLRV